MRILATLLFFTVFGFQVQAADVECSCDGLESKCSDVQINFVPAAPGIYLTIEYAYGKKNTEGFATITRDEKENRVIYQLRNFTLIEKEGKYTLPGRAATCK